MGLSDRMSAIVAILAVPTMQRGKPPMRTFFARLVAEELGATKIVPEARSACGDRGLVLCWST